MSEIEVVSEALLDAAVGVTDATANLAIRPVGGLDPGADAVGNGDLAGAIGSFCRRWQVGVGRLVDDGDQYAARLVAAANAYVGTDVLVAEALRTGT